MSQSIRRGNDYWGPHLWSIIHTFAMCYVPSEENKKHFLQFLETLEDFLPCVYCRIHYKKNLKQMPPNAHFGSCEELFKWTWQFHNLVNEQLGKPQVSYEWARNYYRDRLYTSKYGGKMESFTIDYSY